MIIIKGNHPREQKEGPPVMHFVCGENSPEMQSHMHAGSPFTGNPVPEWSGACKEHDWIVGEKEI